MGKQYSLQGTSEACKVCNELSTKEDYDPCLGELPINIVMNACCGHECKESAYIQFWNGESIRGLKASQIQKILKQ